MYHQGRTALEFLQCIPTSLFLLRKRKNPEEGTMSDIWQLYRIQQIDNQIIDIERKTAAIAPREDLLAESEKREAELEEMKQTLRKKSIALKDRDLEVQKVVTQKKGFEKKLYGGESGNPKELSGWSSEIEALGKKQRSIEDEMLVLMEEIEQIEDEVKKAQDASVQKKEEYTTSEKEREANLKALEQEKENLRAKREKIIQAVDAPLLEKYNELQDHKDGVAIAKITKGICGGCFMTLSESQIKRVARRDLEFCGNCGRILFTDGE
jgi:uncharacterized protein